MNRRAIPASTTPESGDSIRLRDFLISQAGPWWPAGDSHGASCRIIPRFPGDAAETASEARIFCSFHHVAWSRLVLKTTTSFATVVLGELLAAME